MKYSEHKAKWKDCRRCELCDQRKQIVLARGIVPCDVLFVGEAPGASENVLGQPFVGPAGILLDRIILQGLDGQWDYAITNLVACFPRDAKKTKNHEPTKQSIKACAERLREFYQMAKPKAVVYVGKLAELHGPVMLHAVLKGQKEVITTSITHPAAILRMDISQKGLAIQRCVVALEDLAEELAERYVRK